MVVIRLALGGAKKRPFYHIVVADKRRSRNDHFMERLDYFNPMAAGKDVRLTLDTDRLQYWLSNGAQASGRVKHMVSIHKKETATAA